MHPTLGVVCLSLTNSTVKTTSVSANYNKTRGRSAKQRQSKTQRHRSPPDFQPEIAVGTVIRYKASQAITSGQIQVSDLLRSYFIATTSTIGYSILAAVKVKRVEVWGAMASDLSPITVSVEFNSDGVETGARKVSHSDSSMGVTPAFVSAKPVKDSIAGKWQGENSTQNLFLVTCSANSIMDIHVTLVFKNDEDPSGNFGISGAVAGKLYCRKVATYFIPIGRAYL